MRLIVGAVTILSLSASSGALASPSAHLVYTRTKEAAACPDEQTLRKAVAARFGYDPFFAWAKQTVVVLVSRDHGAYAGRVQIVDEEGIARGTRDITSSDEGCSELFDTVALAISIALDATMNLPKKSPPAPESQPTAPDPTPALPELEPTVREAAPMASAKASAPAPPSRWTVGGDVAASAGLGPSAGPRVAAFASVRPSSRLPASVAVELSADWSLPASVAAAGTVTSELYAASFAPCLHYGAGRLCALGEVGWLQAYGSGVNSPSSDGTLFAAMGGRAGAEWPFSDRVFIRFHGDLLYDLERPRFASSTGTVLWDTAVARKPVVGALGIGVGYENPLSGASASSSRDPFLGLVVCVLD